MAKPDLVSLKTQARERAMLYTFEQMYRHQLRYQPKEFKDSFGIGDDDVAAIKAWQRDCDYTHRLVVVTLPKDVDLLWARTVAIKASSKVYIKNCVVSFELGEDDNNPHYNFLFEKSVEWLARSRIIDEFSKTFKVSKNFVDVTMLQSDDANTRADEYIRKEEIWIFDKRQKKCGKPHVTSHKK